MEKVQQALRARDNEMEIAGMNVAWGMYTKFHELNTRAARQFAKAIEERAAVIRGGAASGNTSNETVQRVWEADIFPGNPGYEDASAARPPPPYL